MSEGDAELVDVGSPLEQLTRPLNDSPAMASCTDHAATTAGPFVAGSPPGSPPPPPSPSKQRVKLFFDESSDEDDDGQQSGQSQAGPSSEAAMDVDPPTATDDDEGEDEVDDWRSKDAKLDAEMLDQIKLIDAACKTPPKVAVKRLRAPTSSKELESSMAVKAQAVKLDDSDSDIEFVAGHTGFTPTKKDGIRIKSQLKSTFNFGKPARKEPFDQPKEPVESDLQRRKRLAKELREGLSL